jgi:hypothetical protein
LSFIAERDLPKPVVSPAARGAISEITVVLDPARVRKPAIDDGTDDAPPRLVDRAV